MQGFLWLLLQMTLLLFAAAVVFAMLGWRWRGQNAERDIKLLNTRIDAESAAFKIAQDQRDAALSNDQMLRATQTKIECDLQEANDHRRNLERDLIRVHDELQSAKRDADQRSEDLTAARAALQPTQAEVSALQTQHDQLLREHERLQKNLATQRTEPALIAPVSASPPADQPRKTRLVTTAPTPRKKASTTKPTVDAAATLTRLDTEITTQQTLFTALRQERDDWLRRVSRLREKSTDPAGIGLATKNLIRSESQVAEAQAVLDRLLRQQQVLRHSLEQVASITQDDDLTKIKGIKGVLSNQLHAFGIRSFQQIASWTDSDVEAFSELLAFKDRAKRDEWVKQAQAMEVPPVV